MFVKLLIVSSKLSIFNYLSRIKLVGLQYILHITVPMQYIFVIVQGKYNLKQRNHPVLIGIRHFSKLLYA